MLLDPNIRHTGNVTEGYALDRTSNFQGTISSNAFAYAQTLEGNHFSGCRELLRILILRQK